MRQPRISVLWFLLVYAVAMRLLPYALNVLAGVSIDPETTVYPWNFSPLLPIALFGGAVFAQRHWAVLLPLSAWFLGDLGIWAITGHADWAFYPGQVFVYLAVVLSVALGFAVRRRLGAGSIAMAGFLGAVQFFLLTNFAVWALGGGVTYPLTANGLLACYVAALPFFRNTLISMAVFLPVLFSPIGLTQPARRSETAASVLEHAS